MKDDEKREHEPVGCAVSDTADGKQKTTFAIAGTKICSCAHFEIVFSFILFWFVYPAGELF